MVATLTFLVTDVRRPILSLGALVAKGFRAQFSHTSASLGRDGVTVPMTSRGNLFVLPVAGLATPTDMVGVVSDVVPPMIMPIEAAMDNVPDEVIERQGE